MPRQHVQSLYQLYVKTGNRWRWYCDLLTPTHAEVFRRARQAIELEPVYSEKPIRLEHVEDYPVPERPMDETAVVRVEG